MKSSLNKEVWQLSWPNLLANLSVPLLSIVDTALMGHAQGLYLIGAVAIGTTIFNFLYWSFGFLRMGSSGLTAQAYGREKKDEVIAILGRALICSLLIAAVILLLQTPLRSLTLSLVDGTNEVKEHAGLYFDIRIWAAPATLCLYAFHGWFLGLHRPKVPMSLAIVSNLLNILFSYHFVVNRGLGVEGAAWGTVIAQYLSCFLCFAILSTKFKDYLRELKVSELKRWSALLEFFTVNRDIFIRTVLLLCVISFFTFKSAQFGDSLLAANAILMQLGSLMAYAVDALAFAAESLSGKFIGAKQWDKLRELAKLSFKWGIGIGILFAVIYAFAHEPLLKIFTNKEEILNEAQKYLYWAVLAALINPICFLWDGLFIGATRSKEIRNSMIISSFLVFVPAYYLSQDLGNHGLWLALSLFNLARGLSLYAYRNRIYQQ